VAKPSKARLTRVSTERHSALQAVAHYITDCENKEYDSYVSYCDENGLNPEDIHGKEQSNHVYALALIGIGAAFPKDD
jgi:hypothetical protein